jgi:hypothetical protein
MRFAFIIPRAISQISDTTESGVLTSESAAQRRGASPMAGEEIPVSPQRLGESSRRLGVANKLAG